MMKGGDDVSRQYGQAQDTETDAEVRQCEPQHISRRRSLRL